MIRLLAAGLAYASFEKKSTASFEFDPATGHITTDATDFAVTGGTSPISLKALYEQVEKLASRPAPPTTEEVRLFSWLVV